MKIKSMQTYSTKVRRGGNIRHLCRHFYFCTVLSITLVIGLSHSSEAKTNNNNIDRSSSLSDQEFAEFVKPEPQMDITKLSPQEVLELLLTKFKSKTQHQPKMMFEDVITEKDVADLCAKSASVKCGTEVLERLEGKNHDVDEKCAARKDFIECIDQKRRDCKSLANNGIYPMLPIQSEIRLIREQVAKKLWTSGACVLGPG